MSREQQAPALPLPRPAVNAAITLTVAASGVAALFLSRFVLLPLLLGHLLAADSAARAATAAVLGLLPVAYVAAASLRVRRAPLPVLPGAAVALRAGAEMLVASAYVSLMNVLLGGVLVTASGAAEPTTTVQVTCVSAIFVVFAAGVLLLLLSVSRPIPETVSRRSIQALEVVGLALMALNLPITVALASFA